jgi:hypothetical protein
MVLAPSPFEVISSATIVGVKWFGYSLGNVIVDTCYDLIRIVGIKM